MGVTTKYLPRLMFGKSRFEVICMAGVVAAVGAFQDINPETHNLPYPSPFALSLSKGVSQVRSCFDKLSTNGLLTDVIL